MNKLDKALKNYDSTLTKQDILIPGELGAVISGSRRVSVDGRGQYVYVRLRSNMSEVIQAYNGTVFPGYGLPVLIRWNNNRYEVAGKDVNRYPEWETDNPNIPKHGSTHSLNIEDRLIGTDPVWIYPYQFMPSLVSPFNVSAAENVYIHPYTVNYDGNWSTYGNTGTASIIDYSPTSGLSLVLITVDGNSGNPTLFATTGTYIPTSVSGTSGLVPYLPSIDTERYVPLAFVELSSGTTSISWNNLHDVRQFLGGGISSTVDWDRITDQPTWITEDLSSQADGVNKHFTLAHTAMDKVILFCNILQDPLSYAMDDDYGGFTLSFAPTIFDSVLVRYRYR